MMRSVPVLCLLNWGHKTGAELSTTVRYLGVNGGKILRTLLFEVEFAERCGPALHAMRAFVTTSTREGWPKIQRRLVLKSSVGVSIPPTRIEKESGCNVGSFGSSTLEIRNIHEQDFPQ
jgi:hypothetical protein